MCRLHICRFKANERRELDTGNMTLNQHKGRHSFFQNLITWNDLSINTLASSVAYAQSPLPPMIAPSAFQTIAAKGKLANNTLCSHSLSDENTTRETNASQAAIAGQIPASTLIFSSHTIRQISNGVHLSVCLCGCPLCVYARVSSCACVHLVVGSTHCLSPLLMLFMAV